MTSGKTAQPVTTGAGEELHLFILWNSALNKVREVADELQRSFVLLDVCDVEWSEQHFSSNMSRFYGNSVPPGSQKEKHCGRGTFRVFSVLDRAPLYEQRVTSRCKEIVNIRTFDVKQRLRALTGGGHRVHGTNCPQETAHNVMLLFGTSIREFLAAHDKHWNGVVRHLNRDLTGAVGWAHVAELFHALNATSDYAVLKSCSRFDSAQRPITSLLCSNRPYLRSLLNANAQPWSNSLHTTSVGGKSTLLNLYDIEDRYFAGGWGEEILRTRVSSADGVNLAHTKHDFYLLSRSIVTEYIVVPVECATRLYALAPAGVVLTQMDINNPITLAHVLIGFLHREGFGSTA